MSGEAPDREMLISHLLVTEARDELQRQFEQERAAERFRRAADYPQRDTERGASPEERPTGAARVDKRAPVR